MQERQGRIDLHMHSTVSDGTDTPMKLLDNVRAAGISVFSVTDHDAIHSAQILRGLLKRNDPLFIPGVEFSCKDALGKYHILGYGFDPDAAPLHVLVARGHSLRMQKVVARLKLLQEAYGFVFPEEEVALLLNQYNPGKPHIGNMMIRLGYAASMDDAIDNYIDHVHVHADHILPQEAIQAILVGGGIPVLAHPLFGSGGEQIYGADMEKRLRRLMEYGLQGVEVFYSGFSAAQRSEMLSFAEKFNLYVTAGSDYHGKNKPVVLGDTGLPETGAYPDGLKRFLEELGI